MKGFAVICKICFRETFDSGHKVQKRNDYGRWFAYKTILLLGTS